MGVEDICTLFLLELGLQERKVQYAISMSYYFAHNILLAESIHLCIHINVPGHV
jgi:hypothetical protein